MVPLVIVLDLDGTVIGDITPQLATYEYVKEVKAAGASCEYRFRDMAQKLKAGILRPGFAALLELQKRVPGVELFVYTASEEQWAKFIIAQVEKVCSFKFNRPLFTRKHCFKVRDAYTKSLRHIRPAIFRALKAKYGLQSVRDLDNRVISVDNMDVYEGSECALQVVCPTYEFRYPENLPANITCAEYASHRQGIADIAHHYYGIPHTADYGEFQLKFYEAYVRQLRRDAAHNRACAKDTFFKGFVKVVHHLLVVKQKAEFNDKIVRYINKQLSKRTRACEV